MNKYLNYYILIIVGLLMAVGTFLKLIGALNIDSDFFWLLAGIGLFIEGILTLLKQKTFDNKHKIIKRSEVNNN